MEVQVIYASEFVREGAHGDFDFGASKLALEELARECHKRGINKALLDVRNVKGRVVEGRLEPIFSPDDLASLVNSLYEMGFSKNDRLAVLYATDPFHRSHLFAFIGRIRGWNVAAFDNFEEAFLWLAGGGTSKLSAQAA